MTKPSATTTATITARSVALDRHQGTTACPSRPWSSRTSAYRLGRLAGQQALYQFDKSRWRLASGHASPLHLAKALRHSLITFLCVVDDDWQEESLVGGDKVESDRPQASTRDGNTPRHATHAWSEKSRG